ncbi:hypothetical protein Peur_052720 [Populus x canadensis]
MHPLYLMYETVTTTLVYGICKMDLSENNLLNIAFIDVGHVKIDFDKAMFQQFTFKFKKEYHIHFTLEDGFSFVSFKGARYNLKDVILNQLVDRVLACFQPTKFFIDVHDDVVGE